MGIRGESPYEKAGSATHAFNSTVEEEAIRAKERQLKKVENVLDILTEEEKNYSEGVNTTFRRLLTRIVRKINVYF